MKKTLSLFLCLLLFCSAAVAVSAEAAATLSGTTTEIAPGGTVALTLSLSGTDAATSAAVEFTLGEQLEAVSGQWLKTGAMISSFDPEKQKGVLGGLGTATDLNGDLFVLTVKAKETLSEEQTVTASIRLGTTATPQTASVTLTVLSVPEKFVKPMALAAGDEIADGKTSGDSFGIVGVQLRQVEPAGVRYLARMSKALLAELEARFGAGNVSYGFLLQRGDEGFGDGELTEADVDGKTIAVGGAVFCPGEKQFAALDDYFYYTAVVAGVPESAYGAKIVARAYVKCGDVYYFATEEPSASYEVPGAAARSGGYNVSLQQVADYLNFDLSQLKTNQD